jgi:hypothetical protein
MLVYQRVSPNFPVMLQGSPGLQKTAARGQWPDDAQKEAKVRDLQSLAGWIQSEAMCDSQWKKRTIRSDRIGNLPSIYIYTVYIYIQYIQSPISCLGDLGCLEMEHFTPQMAIFAENEEEPCHLWLVLPTHLDRGWQSILYPTTICRPLALTLSPIRQCWSKKWWNIMPGHALQTNIALEAMPVSIWNCDKILMLVYQMIPDGRILGLEILRYPNMLPWDPAHCLHQKKLPAWSPSGRWLPSWSPA